MNEFDLINESWISLRDKFPFQRGKYLIYDCENDAVGVAKYNGFDFYNDEWDDVKKGNLLIKIYKISHWSDI